MLNAGQITPQQYYAAKLAAQRPAPAAAPATPYTPSYGMSPEGFSTSEDTPEPPTQQQQAAEDAELQKLAVADANKGAPNLTAPPGQAAGAPGTQGPDPNDAALASLVAPRGGGPARAVGLSPADKQYAAALHQQAQDLGGSIDSAVQQYQANTQAFGQQTAILANESKVATAAFQEQQQKNLETRQAIAREAEVNQTRIDARLADLQAQGVDPNHYWQSRSTGEKLAGAFFVGLGALAQGASGGRLPNEALSIYNQAIRDDLDAQRTNLTKSIEVTKMQGESVSKRFDQQMAMARAELESGQTAYTIAINDISRRMGMYQGNAEVQMKGTALIQGLKGEQAKFVAANNEQQYRLAKGAERVTGGGEDLGAKVRALTEKIYLDSKGEVSVEEARRKAFSIVVGPDAKPGAPQTAWGPGAKGAQPSAKEREESSAMQDALADIAEMKRLRKAHNGGSLSPEERARAEAFGAAAAERRLAGIGRVNKQLLQKVNRIIPENPLELNAVGIVGSDPTMAKLNAAEDIIRGELGRRQPGGAASEANGNPADLEEDKEE